MSGDSNTAPPQVLEDFFGVVRLLGDGSVVRGDESVLMPAGPFPDVPGVQWKDAVYDATRGLKVRMYRPPVPAGEQSNKLPVLVYFHGGGYCVGAYDQPMFHSCCQRFAAELPAVVLSVQYRLAPEHRLPAAIDDGTAFISWLCTQAALGPRSEPWLAESADFARTFVSGVSAGANLAHHVVVRIASGNIALGPAVRLAGYILFSAFFGGVERTATEAADVSAVTAAIDQLWRMALPVGATRDHPLANPFGPDSPGLEALPLPPALLVAPGRDMLCGHVLRYAARLKEMGKAVELAEFEEEEHGFSVRGWSEANQELVRILKRFVHHGAARAPSSGETAAA
ncbi:hypothetical protein EJB05_31450, partial [Eragrostis curvula]